MTVTPTAPFPTDGLADAPPAAAVGVEPSDADDRPLVEEDLLVEDVSIDGMCGVY